MRKRHDFFHKAGCRLSDHGLETIDAVEGTALEAAGIFARVRRGNRPSPEEVARFRSAMLHEMALWDHERGWTQQFHIGALRNNNTRMFNQLGADTGFDSIADGAYARGLSRFLDRLDRTDQLAKTILYNLNPRRMKSWARWSAISRMAACPARCSSAAAGGSSIRRRAWRSRSTASRTLGC